MNTTTAAPDDDPRQRRALARFAAVQLVLQARQRDVPLARALQEAAQQAWDGRYYAADTIEDWFYRYVHGHFAALYDQPRRDKGQLRCLDPAAVEALLKLRREHPLLTLPALTQELLRQGVLQPGTFSASSLQRRLAEAGLDRRSLKNGDRFEWNLDKGLRKWVCFFAVFVAMGDLLVLVTRFGEEGIAFESSFQSPGFAANGDRFRVFEER